MLKRFPTTITAQCRNEPEFDVVITLYPHPKFGYRPKIDCPNCGRAYLLQDDGSWFSDRELVFKVQA